MPDDEVRLSLAGEDVVALAERALWWPAAATLFVADIHFGKDAAFRRASRWVPPGTTADNLARLTKIIHRYKARRLVILGDAFHSEHADEPATLADLVQWRESNALEVCIVRGNHDRQIDRIAQQIDFSIVEEGHALRPWNLRHHPVEAVDGYVLCGHVHPVVSARGVARQNIRVPCFWATERQCILPAFGEFTGGSLVRPKQGDRVILIADDRLLDAADCSWT